MDIQMELESGLLQWDRPSML